MTQLSYLNAGETFEIPSLSQSVRSGVVLMSSETAVLVSVNMKEDDDEEWKYKRTRFACSLIVQPTGTVELQKGEDGLLYVKKAHTDKPDVIAEPKVPGTKGRKKKIYDFKFLAGNFTLPELALFNKVPIHAITNNLKDLLVDIKVVGEKRNEGQRGKASKLYSIKD